MAISFLVGLSSTVKRWELLEAFIRFSLSMSRLFEGRLFSFCGPIGVTMKSEALWLFNKGKTGPFILTGI